MIRSPLCTYANLTRNRSSDRGGQRVRKITPHFMCAAWSGKQCADYLAETARQASANYCVGIAGDVAMSVDEDDRAWTSSSGWNDRQAITIECANLEDSSLTDETWRALVSLCADICRRYGFRLAYDGTRDASLTEHRMFASTDCAGAWLHGHMSRLAAEVNAVLDGGKAPTAAPQPSSQAQAEGKEGSGFGGAYRCTVDALNVRDAPSVSGSVVVSYGKGDTVVLDDWYRIVDGYVWGRYTGSSSGLPRYVAVGRPTGGYDPSDYLIRDGTSTARTNLAAGTYLIAVDALRVRAGAGTGYKAVATYSRGERVFLDGTFVSADGYVWSRYTGLSGYKRWVAVGTSGGDKCVERA